VRGVGAGGGAHHRDAIAAGHRVIHVSSHSFTPVLDGVVRDADVGLLYDPARKAEAAFVLRWKTALESHAPDWRIRRNYPYTGTNDGLTTYLRTRFPDHLYAGIELEINQKHVLEDRRAWTMTRAVILRALAETVGSSPHGRAGERGLTAGRAARPLYVR